MTGPGARAALALVDAAAHPYDEGRAIAASWAVETARLVGEDILLTRCAWCGCWRGWRGWVEMQWTYSGVHSVTHGMCPVCARRGI